MLPDFCRINTFLRSWKQYNEIISKRFCLIRCSQQLPVKILSGDILEITN